MEEQIIIDYTQNFLTVQEILSKYKIGQEKLNNILKSHGVKKFHRSESIYMRAARNHGIGLSREELEQAVIDLYNDGNGQAASGRPYGITARAVKFILKKHDIPIRNQQQAAVLSNENRRKLSVNDDYFLTENPNMAWLLGFIAADGSVSKDNNRIKIGLSSIDKEILEKIKEELNIESDILDYTTNNGFPVSELKWTSRKHKQSLRNYNITPNKSLTLQPPHKLDSQYHIDYVRGYFDGDGSISLIKNSNGRGQGNVRFQIAAASKDIIVWILDVLESYGIKRPNILKDSTRAGAPMYYFQLSSTEKKIRSFYRNRTTI